MPNTAKSNLRISQPEAYPEAAVQTDPVWQDDFSLWDAFRHGDEAAFIYLYRQYFDTLINYGLQYFQDKVEVQDFVQDLFIDLRLKRHRLVPLKLSLKAFLLVSLKNRILDDKRKRKVRRDNLRRYSEDFEFILPVEEELVRMQAYREKMEKLKSVLTNLSARQREAIYYLYYENLSYAEIAVLMKLNHVESARNLIYKACKALRKMLQMLVMLIPLPFLELLPEPVE